MKKVLSFVLATALAMGMALSASAADTSGEIKQGEVIGTVNDVSTGTLEIIHDPLPAPRVFTGPLQFSFRANNLDYGDLVTTKNSGKLLGDYPTIGVIASFNGMCTVGSCYQDKYGEFKSTGSVKLSGYKNETKTFRQNYNGYGVNYGYVKNTGRGGLSGTASFYGINNSIPIG